MGRSEKELGKDQVTIELLNYDTGNAKKWGVCKRSS